MAKLKQYKSLRALLMVSGDLPKGTKFGFQNERFVVFGGDLDQCFLDISTEGAVRELLKLVGSELKEAK